MSVYPATMRIWPATSGAPGQVTLTDPFVPT